MLARWRSATAMVAAAIIAMVDSDDGAGFLGPEEALVAATHESDRGMLSRPLVMRRVKGGASLSMELTT